MSFISKISNIIKAPLEAMSDMIREPSKRWEHQRSESSKVSEFQREKERKELALDLSIKQQTGVQKAQLELDEIRKEKDFQRMEKTIKAVQEYHATWAKINTETIKAIGDMQIDLYGKAQDLVRSKTMQFEELQNNAFSQAEQELKRIEDNFANNETARRILTNAVEAKLINIIDATKNFLQELNRDIVLLNNDISSLSKQGQNFIENNLNKFSIANGISQNNNLTNQSYEKEINPQN